MERMAVFAGGCFWGVEAVFRKLPGVKYTKVGYAGGTTDKPTYRQVCRDETGHAESVLIVYNDQDISYQKLLEAYFNIYQGQTCGDPAGIYGSQYRSIIFYNNIDEKEAAEHLLSFLTKSQFFDYPLAVTIQPLDRFYFAEEYHQNYYEKHGLTDCGCEAAA